MSEVSEEMRVSLLTCTSLYLDTWTLEDLKAPYWRVYWNEKPGWEIHFEGEVHQMTKDKVFLIPPETDFKARSSVGCKQHYIHFVASEPYDRITPCVLSVGADKMLVKMLRALDPGADIAHLSRLSYAHSICYYMLSIVPPSMILSRPMHAAVRKAMDAEFDLAKPLSNSEMAKLSGMAVGAFVRLFKKETGISPQVWLTEKRVANACMMLHHTDNTIERIAAACGFCDRYHFSRVFKKLRGMGPAAFRKQRVLFS